MIKSKPEHYEALRSIREYVHSRTLVRYPVSTARRRIGLFGLSIFVAVFGYYTLSTTDAAIRARALRYLEKAAPGGVEIEVGSASFRMFEGITLSDVRVYVPQDDRVDPTATHRKDRKIFSATTLHLVHDPWHLLIGNLRVKRILAVEPEIVLAHNVVTGMRNWELLYDPNRRGGGRGLRTRNRPIVTIRSAHARVVSIGPDGPIEDSLQTLDADLRPAPQTDFAYDIEIRQYRAPIGRATVHFDPSEGRVENSPFVATETIKLQLPGDIQRLFDTLDVNGDVRLERYVYERTSDKERDTRIEMRDVRCNVPLWLLCGRSDPPPEDDPLDADLLLPIATFEDVQGRVELIGDKIEIDVEGRMNGAPAFVRGSLTRAGAEFKHMGVDLRISAEGLPAPEDAVRRRVLADFHSPKAIHEFINDYRPHGRLTVDLQFTRAVNAPGTLRMDGTIEPQGCVGTARWFPYSLEDVRGLVRFDGPDVHLEKLNGNHGSGFITIDGLIDRHTPVSTLDLDIRAYNIPLDVQLFMAMSERYQGVWERFLPYGTANIHTLLHRTGGPRTGRRRKLEKRIVVDLRDVMAIFRPFPYRIEHVDGRLVVDEDRILLHDITGLANGAPILLDGYALLEPDRPTEIDMRLEASDITVDSKVADAFGGPDGALARFEPRGKIDLIGTLFRRATDDDLRWDLHVDGRELDIRHRDFPYAVSDATADVDVATDVVRVNNLTGRHEATNIRATGEWRRDDSGGDEVRFAVSSPSVQLEDDLYAALPESVRQIWDMLEPSGTARVDTRHTMSGPSAARVHRHVTRIDPLAMAIKFRYFPLPISSLTGSVVVTEKEVIIKHVSGAIGNGRITVDGTIQLLAQGVSGRLAVTASDVELSPALLDAMPAGLGAWLQKARPHGKLSANLTQLAFDADETGQFRWQIEGATDLHGFSAKLGMALDNADGTLAGTCTIERSGSVRIDTRAEFSRLDLGGWSLRDVRGRLVSDPAVGALLVRDGVARLYGGDATGEAKVLFNGDTTEYEASLLFRDVQLQSFLEAQRQKGPRPESQQQTESARGMLEGNFAMQGRTGPRAYREGAGNIYIRQAQVWKLPFALAIFQVLNLTPDENVFHDGRIELFLTDDKLILHKIDLQGKAMAFIGGGTLNLDTNDLDLRLLAASPVRVQVPILTEILEGVAREAMELHVTGTVDSPRIQPEPMRQTRDVLDTLFPEIPRRRRP